MRKFLLGVPLVLGVASSGLVAEKGGGFLGISYQVGQGRMNTNVYNENGNYPPGTGPNYDNWQGTNMSWTAKYGNGAMNGFGVRVGQSFFFKPANAKTAWLGVRYYGFFDYGFSDLGPQLSLVDYNKNVRLNMTAYGVGTDILGDFIDRDSVSVGAFAGFAIGGNTWQSSASGAWEKAIEAKLGRSVALSPSHGNFNVWLNFGFRTNIHKHNGVELGIKIPMLINKFLSANGIYYHLKRDYSVYLGYLYTF